MPPPTLYFPSPVGRQRLAHDDDDSNDRTTFEQRQPPPNFASMRSAARALRAAKTKSPFVPKKVQRSVQAPPLERYSLDELKRLRERNEAALASSDDTFSSFDNARERIVATQQRVQERIDYLEHRQNTEQVRHRLESTKLNDPSPSSMADSNQNGEDQLSISPRARSLIAAEQQSLAHRGMTSPLSMAESLALQKQAAERAAAATAQAELDAQKRAAYKRALSTSKEKNERMMNFLFAGDSDSDDEDDDMDGVVGDYGAEHEQAHEINPSFLEDDEDRALNPIRTAYMLGWNLAKHEETVQARDSDGRDEPHLSADFGT